MADYPPEKILTDVSKKDPKVYLEYKKKEFSEDDRKIIIKDFKKRLLTEDRPSLFLNEYFKLSILKKIFPSLYRLTLTIHDPVFHPEKDINGLNTVWGHTCFALDISAKLARKFDLDENESFVLILGTLLHDIGKPSVTDWEYKRGRLVVSSISHDYKGVGSAANLLDEINIIDVDNFPVRTLILKLVKYHHRLFELHRNRELIKINAFNKLQRDMLGYERLLILLDFADRQSREENALDFNDLDEVSIWAFEKFIELKKKNNIPKQMIFGRDLIECGIKPGKKMGEILKNLYDRQLKKEFSTREEGIKLVKEIYK